MTSVDDLWYLGDRARQRAERTFHEITSRHEDYVEFSRERYVSRSHFRTLANRITDTGLPYGAHTVVYRDTGEILLVRHSDVDMWVIPGGEVDPDETFVDAARRELREEAGIDCSYEGLGMLARIDITCDDHHTWGILPIYQAESTATELTVNDPDGEITDAKWFGELPSDTRDRDQLLRWRRNHFEE